MKNFWFIFTFLLFLTSSVIADDAPVQPTQSGTVKPFNSKSIQMKNETIDIYLYQDYYKVIVNYTFVNFSRKQKLIMGFPNQTDAVYTSSIKDFKAYDGKKKLKIFKKFKAGQEKKEKYETKDFFECFNITFNAKETKKIKNIYTQKYTTNYDDTFRGATYILTTGAFWKGVIEKIDINIHFSGIPPHEIIPRTAFFSKKDLEKYKIQNTKYVLKKKHLNIMPKKFKLRKNKAVMTFKNVEPNFNIEIKLPNKLKTISATSQLRSKNKTYIADKAIDHNIKTAWVEGKKNNGIGEKITVNITPSIAGGKIDGAYLVDKIGIVNGYPKSKSTYLNNNRVKKLKLTYHANIAEDDNSDPITIKGKKEYIFNLIDSHQIQYLKFDKPVLMSNFTFEILEIYKGRKYKDTCIAEVYVYVQ